MAKAAIVLLAGTDSSGDLGRVVNGLETANEFERTPGDDVELVFDGAGTQWIPTLDDEEHDYHDLYQAVRDDATACEYCANAFGVADEVAETSVGIVDEHEGHPSIRSLVADGYEVITF